MKSVSICSCVELWLRISSAASAGSEPLAPSAKGDFIFFHGLFPSNAHFWAGAAGPGKIIPVSHIRQWWISAESWLRTALELPEEISDFIQHLRGSQPALGNAGRTRAHLGSGHWGDLSSHRGFSRIHRLKYKSLSQGQSSPILPWFLQTCRVKSRDYQWKKMELPEMGNYTPGQRLNFAFQFSSFFFAFLFFPFPTWTAGTRQSAPANPYKWAVKLKLWPLSVQKSCDTTQECWFLVWINAFQIQSRFRRRGKCCQIKRIKVGFVKGLWLGAHCAKPERVLRKSVLKKMAQKNHRRFKLLILKENTWKSPEPGAALVRLQELLGRSCPAPCQDLGPGHSQLQDSCTSASIRLPNPQLVTSLPKLNANIHFFHYLQHTEGWTSCCIPRVTRRAFESSNEFSYEHLVKTRFSLALTRILHLPAHCDGSEQHRGVLVHTEMIAGFAKWALSLPTHCLLTQGWILPTGNILHNGSQQ